MTDTDTILKEHFFPIQLNGESGGATHICPKAYRFLYLYDENGEHRDSFLALINLNGRSYDSDHYSHFGDYQSAVDHCIDKIINMDSIQVEKKPDPEFDSQWRILSVGIAQFTRRYAGNFIIGSKEYLESIPTPNNYNVIDPFENNEKFGKMKRFTVYDRDLGNKIIIGGSSVNPDQTTRGYDVGMPIVYNDQRRTYTPIHDVIDVENYYKVINL